MNRQKSKSGFSYLMIIIVILAVVLLGTLGFVFYQNFMQKKDTSTSSPSPVSKTTTPTKTKTPASTTTTTTTPSTSTTTTTTPTDPNASYLALDDWSVKFKIPTDLGNNQILYYKQTSSTDNGGTQSYAFSTSRVEALGGICNESSVESGDGSLGAITRTGTKIPDGYVDTSYINEINGYFYYYTPSQAPCSETSTDIQSQDRATLQTMLTGVEQE